jgi:alpha-beta hydrolase superfamily lysophospholipase
MAVLQAVSRCSCESQLEAKRMLMTVPVLSEPAEGFIDVDGGRLHYPDWGGEGAHTHFLHGNGFCAGTHAPFIRHLTPGLRVIASDVRGHGGSGFLLIESIRHWNLFAEDLRRLIRRIMAPPIVGMGHSLGAVAAPELNAVDATRRIKILEEACA